MNGAGALRVGIHQPHYQPWLRYFDKVARCDAFVVLDTVQFTKNGWQNRNKIKGPDGPVRLTVPVRAALGQTLAEVRIDNAVPWRRKHWRTIEQCYRKAPCFEAHAIFLHETYAREWEFLNDLNRHMLEYLVTALGITTRIAYATGLAVSGTATERLANLVRAVGGDRYLTGAYAAEAYLDVALLERAGIAVETQAWRALVYPQLYGEFVPDLSILDLLLNCGPDSLSILLGERVA